MGIGNKLTKLMKEQSTNANELAIKANVPPTTIYSLIKRDSNRVDIDSLIRIARALGVTAEYFCNENIPEELTSTRTDFNENLKIARERKGLSQKELSENIGVTKSTYSLYESGNREPNVQTIKKIATALAISADELLGIQEEQTNFNSSVYLKNNLENNEQKSFKDKLIEGMGKLDKSDWKDLERIISKVTNSKEEIDYYEEAPKTPEELRQKYPVENINNSKIS